MEIPAKVYNCLNKPHVKDALSTINNIEKYRYEIIVDIGCGTGNITKILSGKYETSIIFGFDMDPELIEFAQKENSNEGVMFNVCNIEKKWEDQPKAFQRLESKVDLVFSNAVLHWIVNKEEALRNIQRLMKYNGKFVGNFWGFPDFKKYIPDELTFPDGQKFWKKFLSIEEQCTSWREAFENAKFGEINISFQEREELLASSKDLENFYIGFSSFTIKILGNKQVFDKISEDTKQKITGFACRNMVTKLNDPPKLSLIGNEKTFYYGLFNFQLKCNLMS